LPFFLKVYALNNQDLKQILKLEQEALKTERSFCPLFLEVLIEANEQPNCGF